MSLRRFRSKFKNSVLKRYRFIKELCYKRYCLIGAFLKELLEQNPWVSWFICDIIGLSLKFRASLSRADISRLTILADRWADNGFYESARRLYDRIFRFRPTEVELYLRQYEALGGRLFLNGLRKRAIYYWVLQRELQDRLAKKRGFLPSKVIYLGREWSMAYGHQAITYIYVQKNLLRKQPKKIVLFANKNDIANQALLKLYEPYLEVNYSPVPNEEAILLSDKLSVMANEEGKYSYLINDFLEVKQRWLDQERPPLFQLTQEDHENGKLLLEKLGADPDRWFVCLHVRDGGTWGDRYSRNGKLETYAQAIAAITEHGGQVIRIGPKLDPPSNIPHLIDYASGPHRTEWGDVFLTAACRFFLGTNSGPSVLPDAFGVPSALTNWHPFGEGPLGGLYIPKLLWHEKQKRYLTYSEMLQPPFEATERQLLLKKHDLLLIDNKSEDIAALSVEMLQCLNKTISYTNEDREAQDKFQKIMKKCQPAFSSQISTTFLRKYPELLA